MVDVGVSVFYVEVGRDGNVSLLGDVLIGDEGLVVLMNGDVFGRRM